MSNVRIEYTFNTKRLMEYMRGMINKPQVSLRDLEAVCGISASTLSRIDGGKVPDMETLLTICSRLEIDPGELFDKETWKKVEA